MVSRQDPGDPGELDTKCTGLKTRKANGVVLILRLAGSRPKFSFNSRLKGGKKPNASSKAVQQEEFSLIQGKVRPFVLLRPSMDWTRPTHIREGNLLDLEY